MNQDMDFIVKAVEEYQKRTQKSNEDNKFLEFGLTDGKYYKVEKGQRDSIQYIVDKVERYDDVREFINDSIDKIVDFWLHPEKMMQNAKGMWPDFTDEMKEEIKKNAPEFYQQMEQLIVVHNKLATIKKEIVDAVVFESISSSEVLWKDHPSYTEKLFDVTECLCGCKFPCPIPTCTCEACNPKSNFMTGPGK